MERFRIHFDSWAKQSELERALPALLGGLPTYEHDGATFVRSTELGDEKDRVLVRSPEKGGLPTYEAADIAYLRDKLERGFDRAIYVLGADHHGVAGWYAVVARMLGYDPARVEVLLYQLVHLTRAGEAAKMSKRRGDVVFLDEFLEEIGVDAARWYLVNRGPDQAIEIDVDLAAEKSQKNPVYYVQYAHARIAGILRNAEGAEVGGTPPGPLEPHERELVKRLAEFPGIVREATERRAPQALPVYAIKVADDFHRFYHDVRVLGSDAQSFRLGLCRAAQRVIARSLDLVGVEAPDRM
jgi:arginyl-tRNA synthetase